LFDLIGLGLAAIALHIDSVRNAVLGEDVMTAVYPQFETQIRQQMDKVGERDLGVCGAAENALEHFRRRRHDNR
jgi:hypothetical protein